MTHKSISFYTLGCKLNQAETGALKNAAEASGYICVDFDEPADVMVVNSCTLTNRADRKTRQALTQARHRSPEGILVLAGCFPQIFQEVSQKLPGVDIVLGNRDKFDLFAMLPAYEKAQGRYVQIGAVDNDHRLNSAFIAATGRTRAFLKIQEGCSNFCTYCIVPYARGNPVSRDFDNTVTEARRLAEAGYKEIVLTGIDIGAYNDSGKGLLDLAVELEKISGLERIRISSIEMNTLSDELIRHIGSSEKIMPHFHLSLQSGSDTILKAMNRKYHTHDFSQKVDTIRKFVANASIGTDIIVGFPGENDAMFNETLHYLDDIQFSYLHVFRYSARTGTPAAKMKGQVSETAKKERASILNDTDNILRIKYAASFEGTYQSVLWESYEDEMLSGYTPHYIPVRANGSPANRNTISKILLNKENISLFL
ncbi:MAG: tRNA (N(6)-L-threonylcarbamoyladenosine(37)-C(2))-methylthiotransferase MtaB [FCB group bacterium]|nr:tRNA (N(6)-L-threonylcarbamoyladenosine(37)-C(2))-methylthiotransferase MtaB [FCB group bacterium]